MDPKTIKAARDSRRLSQRALAAVAGISPSQMSRVEAGTRRLRHDEAVRIAVKLNLDSSNIVELSAPRQTGKSTSIILPEGTATVEYPARLSEESRQDLKQWLELIARVVSR